MALHRSFVLLVLAAALAAAAAKPSPPPCPVSPETVQLPNATSSGYLDVDDVGSKLFYLYYEQQGSGAVESDGSSVPITLWLQGGPGCASLFGAFYELGPELVDERLGLRPNPGAWNRRSALLFIDQPVGSGFSLPGKHRRIPRDEMELAADVYSALQAFFLQFPELQSRPLVIAGESYAGKYVPSIGHFILQQSAAPNGTLLLPHSSSGGRLRLNERRPVSPALLVARALLSRPPLFRLAGLAIGNGLTDPVVQVMSLADTAYFQGCIDPRQRLRAMTMQLETVQLISAGFWEEAHALRSGLLEHIRSSAGVATLLDMRRYEDYDAGKLVDCYLNLPEVKEALGVDRHVTFESCSEAVGDALGPDVMKSVKRLIPDLLKAQYPLLLYQGMHDAQDGPASSEAWIYSLEWEGRSQFAGAKRSIVRARDVPEEGEAEEGKGEGGEGGDLSAATRMQKQGIEGGEGGEAADDGSGGSSLRAQLLLPSMRRQQQGVARHHGGGGAGDKVVAYWKQGAGLTHVVLSEAGHMAPRDDPQTTRWMLERWLDESVLAAATAAAANKAAGPQQAWEPGSGSGGGAPAP